MEKMEKKRLGKKVSSLLDEKLRHYRYKRRVIFGLSLFVLLMIYFSEGTSYALRAVSTAAFLILFYMIDHTFDIRFRRRHYIFIIIIAVTGFLLGPLYYIYPNYDKIQHLIQPMLVCSIIFFLTNKLNIELKWKWTFAVFITIAILGLFEIGEYSLDHLFDLKLQGVYLRDMKGIEKFNLLMNPLDDTMIDLVLGTFGASIYGIAGFIYLKYYKKKMILAK